MSLVLDLPKDLEADLKEEAELAGVSLTEFVLRILEESQKMPALPRTGHELIEYWKSHGLIGSQAQVSDTPELSRLIREEAQRRPTP